MGRKALEPRRFLFGRLFAHYGDTGEITVMFKFASKEDARKIYDGDAYRELIPKRLAVTSHHFAVLVDGPS